MIDKIKLELARGFTKSELERIWELPKNSLSAILADNIKKPKKLSGKATIRLTEYFKQPIEKRPTPTDKIEKNKTKDKKGGEKKEPNQPKHPQGKWDFSKVMFFNIEEFTEYPKNQCPPNGYQRNDYLAAKKIADDKIRAAFRNYKK